MTVLAWIMLSSDDPEDECATNAPQLTELLVDMIILLYMRSLRLLSILIFVLLCGPVLLYCWWTNRPEPTEDPGQINENFVKVTYDQLLRLREKNYRHKSVIRDNSDETPKGSERANSVVANEDPDKAPGGDTSMDTSVTSVSAWDLEQGINDEDLTCCICMEDIKDCTDEDNPSLVILPCKAHFFHE